MKKRSGLTLIETLTILAIMAILTTLIGLAIGGILQKQREVRIDVELAMIAKATTDFRVTHPGETPTMDALVESGSLVKPVPSPIKGYRYVLKPLPGSKDWVITLEKGGSVYVRGPYRAEIRAPGL